MRCPSVAGTFRLSWVVRELPDVSLVRYATATSIREAYVKEPGSTAFVLVLPGGDEPLPRPRSASSKPVTLTLLQPGVEYEVVSPAGGEALEVYVPDELVAQLGLDRWLDPDVVERAPRCCAGCAGSRRGWRPSSPPGESAASIRPPSARRSLEALAATLDSVDPSAAPAPTVRLHAVYRRAIAAIESDPDPMLTVVELAARLGRHHAARCAMPSATRWTSAPTSTCSGAG